MRKNRTKNYFTAILLMHILVYFFKVDRDVFAITEFCNRPDQTYTEQPYTKGISYFDNIIFSLSQSCVLPDANNHLENVKIWNAISHSYNLQVSHLLKLNKSHFLPSASLVSISYRQNIHHKSSDDEDLES